MKTCIICNKEFNVRDYAIAQRDKIKCCSLACSKEWRGKEENRLLQSLKVRSLPNYKNYGANNLRRLLRANSIYHIYTKKVLSRDNYTCQLCGYRNGDICVDHIKPFVKILEEFGIDTYEKAVACPELWDINNARTLCYPCHFKTETYGSKVHKY
jgi:hypothetical protein